MDEDIRIDRPIRSPCHLNMSTGICEGLRTSLICSSTVMRLGFPTLPVPHSEAQRANSSSAWRAVPHCDTRMSMHHMHNSPLRCAMYGAHSASVPSPAIWNDLGNPGRCFVLLLSRPPGTLSELVEPPGCMVGLEPNDCYFSANPTAGHYYLRSSSCEERV